MGVRVEAEADVAILRLQGNFFGDRETEKLRSVVRQLAASGNTKLAIDLGGVHRLNSMALTVLYEAHAEYTKRGGRIILAQVDKCIEDVLIVTRLVRLFEIGPTLSEALAKLGV